MSKGVKAVDLENYNSKFLNELSILTKVQDKINKI